MELGRFPLSLKVVEISVFYHDSACCLLSDRELVCAAEEERFSRLEHDSGQLSRQIWTAINPSTFGNYRNYILSQLRPRRVEREIREILADLRLHESGLAPGRPADLLPIFREIHSFTAAVAG
jgi:hypothetical protein